MRQVMVCVGGVLDREMFNVEADYLRPQRLPIKLIASIDFDPDQPIEPTIELANYIVDRISFRSTDLIDPSPLYFLRAEELKFDAAIRRVFAAYVDHRKEV